MSADQIERETVIAAPVERVWALLTEAEHVGRWFGDAGAEIELRPGGALSLSWEEHGTVRGRVGRRRAAAALQLSLGRPARRVRSEPVDGNSTLVEFTLEAEGEGTRLRVVESGFANLDASGRDRATSARGQPQGLGPRARRRCATYAQQRRRLSAR